MKEYWIPHDYQKYCIAEGIKRPNVAFFLDPGMGKTSLTLALFKHLKQQSLVKNCLILAPKRPAFMTWGPEIEKWANFEGLTHTVLHSDHANKDKEYNKDYDLYIMNIDGIPWLFEQMKTARGGCKFDMLVVDESTKFKNITAKRTKLLLKMAKKFDRRYILTGTPTPEALQNIQGQIAIVDGGESFGTAKTRFLNTYFIKSGSPMWPKYEPNPELVDRIYAKCAKYCVRLKASDHLKNLPTRIVNTIHVELPPKAAAQYDQMQSELGLELEGKTITALTESVVYQKCHQIANGACYVDEEGVLQPGLERKNFEFVEFHDEKIKALEDLIEELQGKQLLIAYNFKHDILRLKKHFGNKLKTIPKSIEAANKVQRDWNDGKIQLLAAYPGSDALGLNLQKRCQDVCFFSLVHSHEAYHQFILRVGRQGNTASHVRVHHILAKKTVDNAIMRAHAKKAKAQEEFLEAVKQHINNKKA